MSDQDVFLELIDQVAARVGPNPWFLVATVPLSPQSVQLLLDKFPRASVVVAEDDVASLPIGPRIGRRYGPYLSFWDLPPGRYGTAVLIGSLHNIGFRALRSAVTRGVRTFIFCDPVLQSASSMSSIRLAALLGWQRLNASIQARLQNLLAKSDRLLAPVAGRFSAFWERPEFDPLRTRLARSVNLVHDPIRDMTQRVFKRRANSEFIVQIEKLFHFAERAVTEHRAHSNCVALAIGTVGPGGSERQVVNTALALAADGRYRPVVMCSNLGEGASAFYRPILEKAGVELVDLKKLTTADIPREYVFFVEACRLELSKLNLSIVDDVIKFLIAILKIRPQIVHSFLDDTNIKAGVAGVLAQVPRIILSLRSVAPNNFPLLTPFMRPGYRLLLDRPEVKLTANSVAGMVDYRQWLRQLDVPIEIIRNGIDFSDFKPRVGSRASERAKYGIPADVPVLGTIMRMTEEKRPMRWAEAALEISRRRPDVFFVMIGDGPLRNDVIHFLNNGRIGSRIYVPGHLKDIPSVLQCFDVFLLTSRLEGLPNVLIEAQAMGVPVVTTPAGGAVEALDSGHTGLITPDHSVLGIAETCLRILDDTEFKTRLAEAGPAFVRRTFSVEKMMQSTVAFYAEEATVSGR